ncbi:hypothetical protein B0H66DRAFT_534861 [Apodospora peruviana]|uniref:Uncharacterized protein n=1 Tax=Apodospora peruviana TaxID=516989 RepID=A0AAE0I175_9PEZI|nr:hypothetical protein B0H66DRAFT_534861 [Apodospora peruviana]
MYGLVLGYRPALLVSSRTTRRHGAAAQQPAFHVVGPNNHSRVLYRHMVQRVLTRPRGTGEQERIDLVTPDHWADWFGRPEFKELETLPDAPHLNGDLTGYHILLSARLLPDELIGSEFYPHCKTDAELFYLPFLRTYWVTITKAFHLSTSIFKVMEETDPMIKSYLTHFATRPRNFQDICHEYEDMIARCQIEAGELIYARGLFISNLAIQDTKAVTRFAHIAVLFLPATLMALLTNCVKTIFAMPIFDWKAIWVDFRWHDVPSNSSSSGSDTSAGDSTDSGVVFSGYFWIYLAVTTLPTGIAWIRSQALTGARIFGMSPRTFWNRRTRKDLIRVKDNICFVFHVEMYGIAIKSDIKWFLNRQDCIIFVHES